MATAARPSSGNYTTLYTHVLEQWFNSDKAVDIVSRSTPLLWFMMNMADTKQLPHDVNVRIMESLGEGVDSFEYYDNLSNQASKGAQAARFEVSNYQAPITMSWQEEMEFTSPEAIADRIQEYVQQQEITLGQRLAEDFYKGAETNTTNIIGLETLCGATTQISNANNTTSNALEVMDERYQARQSTNSYGGITRTAFTSATVGGTHWEAVNIDFFDSVSNAFQFDSNGRPDQGLKGLYQLYDFCSYGIEHPDFIVSTPKMYYDYEFANAQKLQIQRGGTPFSDGDVTFDNLKFKNAIWFPDELCVTYNAIGNSAVAEPNNLYMLNSNHFKLLVDSRANMSLVPPAVPTDQLAAVRRIVWRGQLICDSPRTVGRIFSYNS